MDDDAILGTRALWRGWFDLLLVRLCLNGRIEERPMVRHPSGSAVLAFDPARRVAFVVRQTRVAVLFRQAKPGFEVIAGVCENDDYPAAARREAMEEAGVRLAALDPVGTVWMDPSTSTEQVHLFLASYAAADRVGEGGGLAVENERLVVEERPLGELWGELAAADAVDAKTLLLFQALRLRRPALFA